MRPPPCPPVGLSVTLSLKLRKTAEFTENHGSLRERTTNQGSGSINESCTQSITHSNHSYTSQGASLAYVGLVTKAFRKDQRMDQRTDGRMDKASYRVACPQLIVAKALDGQRYPLPLCEFIWMCDGKRGSGPEGANDLCLVSLELQC